MVENTLNVGRISEGFVLDHIEAGKSMDIYKYLHLDKLDCCVAIIKNAQSSKMGKKDIPRRTLSPFPPFRSSAQEAQGRYIWPPPGPHRFQIFPEAGHTP